MYRVPTVLLAPRGSRPGSGCEGSPGTRNNQALFTMDVSLSFLKIKTEFSRQRISYTSLDQWNDLSEAIKGPISLNAFKAKPSDHLRAAAIVFNILYIDFSPRAAT